MDLEARAQLDPVRRLPAEETRLLQFFRGLKKADWTGPTMCGNWTVDRLATHLVITGEYLCESARTVLDAPRSAASFEAPLPFGAADRDEFLNWWRGEIKRLMVAGTNVQLDKLEKSAGELQTQLSRIDSGNASFPFWHPSGEATLGDIPTFRLFELQFHEWDLHAPENPGVSLNQPMLPLMADRLPRMLGRYARLRTEPNQAGGRIRILLTEPGGNFLLDWSGKDSRSVIDDGGDVAVTLTSTSTAFLLLLTGRAERSRCEKEGTFHLLGDTGLGAALADVLFQPAHYL